MIAPEIDRRTATWRTLLNALFTGMLAATPFAMCVIYSTMYSLYLFPTWQTKLYCWSVVAIQVYIFFVCLLMNYVVFRTELELLCGINVVGLGIAFFLMTLQWFPSVSIPCTFIINLVCLSWWVPITHDSIYLCAPIVHRYYEIGFLGAIVCYYHLLYYSLYNNVVFLIPLCCFLIAGLFALRNLQRDGHFLLGVERRRAIYVQLSNDFITHSLKTTVYIISHELFVISCLTIGISLLLIFVTLETTSIMNWGSYASLLCVGSLCCGGFSVASHFMALLFGIFSVIVATILFVCANALGPALCNGLLALMIVFYFNALLCEISIIRKKLSRGLNTPRICLCICLICNLIVSCTLILLNDVKSAIK